MSRQLHLPWHISSKCQLGAMRDLLGAAKLTHKIATQLTYYTEQENRERTSGFVV